MRIGHMFESVGSGADGGREPAADPPDLDGLEHVPPGRELVSVLASVHPDDVVDAYDLVELAAACRRLKAWAEGIEIETAAALVRNPACNDPAAARNGFSPIRAAGQLLAARLGLAPSTGADRVATAVQVVEELPDTLTALFRGEIDYSKAAALAIGVRALDPPDAMQDAVTGEKITADGLRRGLVAMVEARVLPKAGSRSLRQHRDAITRAVAAVAPATLEQRHERACEQRRVDFRSDADAMAWLNVYGPAEDVAAIKAMVDAAADAAKAADPHGPRTLIGIDDSPAELVGYGPIPADVARRIAAHGTWRRLLTDPATGALLDYGQTRYTPPQDLLDHVTARDRSCRFSTCSQPARRCQADHTTPAGAPGWSTSASNLGMLCPSCHNAKTQPAGISNNPNLVASAGVPRPVTTTTLCPNRSAPSWRLPSRRATHPKPNSTGTRPRSDGSPVTAHAPRARAFAAAGGRSDPPEQDKGPVV